MGGGHREQIGESHSFEEDKQRARQSPLGFGGLLWRGGGGGGSFGSVWGLPSPPNPPIPPPRYDYKIAREYNWNVKNKASKGYEENYFFIFREGDGVYYNELETRWGWGGALADPPSNNGERFGVGEGEFRVWGGVLWSLEGDWGGGHGGSESVWGSPRGVGRVWGGS